MPLLLFLPASIRFEYLIKNKALRIPSSFCSAHFFKTCFKHSGLQPAAGACVLNVKPNPKFQIYTSSETMAGFPQITPTLKISFLMKFHCDAFSISVKEPQPTEPYIY